MAKDLFLINLFNNRKLFFLYSEISHFKKIAILVFRYDAEELDLLKNYRDYSIDLREPSTHDRLKKIVLYYSRVPKPG